MTPVLSRSIAGMTVFITGAGSGIGRATAAVFAKEGANVAVSDLNGAAARALAEDIAAAGGAARAWALDVRDGAAIVQVVHEAGAHFGGLDCLVNNAGVASFMAIDAPTYEDTWTLLHEVLLRSQTRVIRAALPLLRLSACGRIVNIASVEALGALSNNSIYCAFKAGVTGLTRALAVELGKEAITVNCICPGPIDTGMTAMVSDAEKATYARRRTALRRYGLPEEIAHMVVNLCMPAASYVTGAVIPVDGGMMARNG